MKCPLSIIAREHRAVIECMGEDCMWYWKCKEPVDTHTEFPDGTYVNTFAGTV